MRPWDMWLNIRVGMEVLSFFRLPASLPFYLQPLHGENVYLVDLHPHFSNEQGKLNKNFTMYGLHLNAEGYKLWKHVLGQGRCLTKKDKNEVHILDSYLFFYGVM